MFKKLNMIYLKRWFIILVIAVVTLTAFDSCRGHRRHKRIMKHRRASNARHYKSPYQRKFKRKTIPINKNFIIKNKRR